MSLRGETKKKKKLFQVSKEDRLERELCSLQLSARCLLNAQVLVCVRVILINFSKKVSSASCSVSVCVMLRGEVCRGLSFY